MHRQRGVSGNAVFNNAQASVRYPFMASLFGGMAYDYTRGGARARGDILPKRPRPTGGYRLPVRGPTPCRAAFPRESRTMSRKFILKGDTTDHGGVVLDGIANSSFDGRELAYLGSPVFCAACKTQGVIVSDGGERTMTVMGKVVALEHDLCQCLCTPQPKLIPSQATGTLSG
ncbi:hypothetical protein BamMEX5DRAFT_2021 [Burkholderia ambifaria MEX-5]|uniref:PAAR repeat-containing protein n=2 Tax=Burkholderia ambifaria TaxID=152480 RepID=B1T2K5_9BURK|nr:hypothetical protein BamMEX5DRAFT_2021 [Burkholderia ambifaria MEX-5]